MSNPELRWTEQETRDLVLGYLARQAIEDGEEVDFSAYFEGDLPGLMAHVKLTELSQDS